MDIIEQIEIVVVGNVALVYVAYWLVLPCGTIMLLEEAYVVGFI